MGMDRTPLRKAYLSDHSTVHKTVNFNNYKQNQQMVGFSEFLDYAVRLKVMYLVL